MKTYLLPSLKLTLVLIVLCAILYPIMLAGIAKVAPGSGDGKTVNYNGMVVGFENIGQKFTEDSYFNGRPSAVNYNAAASGASNKGPTNPEYLALIQATIDTFLVHNPDIKKSDIPVELVTASGSGLDPDISLQAARIQVPRIAKIRNKNEKDLYELIDRQKEGRLFGFLGPEKINVLKINIALNML